MVQLENKYPRTKDIMDGFDGEIDKNHQIYYNIESEIENLEEDLINTETSKNQAYAERNKLLSFISSIFPAHLTKHPEDDKNWESDWFNIVCIHFPTGSAAWHIHDSELDLFNHLSYEDNNWDGHTTEEKYERISKYRDTVLKEDQDNQIVRLVKELGQLTSNDLPRMRNYNKTYLKSEILKLVTKNHNIQTKEILERIPIPESWQILELLDELQLEGKIQ